MKMERYVGVAVGQFGKVSRGIEAIPLHAILEARKLSLNTRCAISRMVIDRPKSPQRYGAAKRKDLTGETFKRAARRRYLRARFLSDRKVTKRS